MIDIFAVYHYRPHHGVFTVMGEEVGDTLYAD